MANPPLPPELSPPSYDDAAKKVASAWALSETVEDFHAVIRAMLQSAFLDGVTAALKNEAARADKRADALRRMMG